MSIFKLRTLWSFSSPTNKQEREERSRYNESRIWVDYKELETCLAKSDSDLLTPIWSRSGLTVLNYNHPEIPHELNKLLRVNQINQYLMKGIMGIALLIAVVTLFYKIYTNDSTEFFATWAMLWLGICLFIFYKPTPMLLKKLIGHNLSIQWNSRLSLALASLRSHPFIIVIDGMLVENLPTLYWFNARSSELDKLAMDTTIRKNTLNKMAVEIRSTLAHFDEHEEDQILNRIITLSQAQDRLHQRSRKLEKKINKKIRKIKSKLDPIRERFKSSMTHSQDAVPVGSDNIQLQIPISTLNSIEPNVVNIKRQFSEFRQAIIEQEEQIILVLGIGKFKDQRTQDFFRTNDNLEAAGHLAVEAILTRHRDDVRGDLALAELAGEQGDLSLAKQQSHPGELSIADIRSKKLTKG